MDPALNITCTVWNTSGSFAPGATHACTLPVASDTVAESSWPTFESHHSPNSDDSVRNVRCRYGLSSMVRSDSRPIVNGAPSSTVYHSPQNSTRSGLTACTP